MYIINIYEAKRMRAFQCYRNSSIFLWHVKTDILITQQGDVFFFLKRKEKEEGAVVVCILFCLRLLYREEKLIMRYRQHLHTAQILNVVSLSTVLVWCLVM